LNMSGGKWTRPNEVPYPNVWKRYEGKREIEGVKPVFLIQDVTEDLEDEIVEHMTTVFLQDEPMCKAVGMAEDPVSLKEFQDMWRDYMKYKIALVAVVEPGTSPYPARVAGCNLLGVTNKSDKVDTSKYKGEAFQKMVQTLEYMNEKAKVFEKYDVDHYIARFELGRAVGLPLTVTLFSPPSTQWMGGQCGMETLVELDYEDYKDEEGRVVFPGMPHKSMKLMAGWI
ncbi:hypothetical protein L9F63_015703, partial [Diploptera punctata]